MQTVNLSKLSLITELLFLLATHVQRSATMSLFHRRVRRAQFSIACYENMNLESLLEEKYLERKG